MGKCLLCGYHIGENGLYKVVDLCDACAFPLVKDLKEREETYLTQSNTSGKPIQYTWIKESIFSNDDDS